MARVKLNFKRLSVPEKIAKARQIVASLTGNATFANPVPPLATLGVGLDALDDAYTSAQANKQAWHGAVDVQTAKEDALDQLISQCVSYVDSVAGLDDSVIASAGMDARPPIGSSTLPETPNGLDVTIGDHEGELDLSWDPVTNAMSYLVQKSLDPNNAAGWTQAGTSTKSTTTIDGLTSGTRFWFRVAAVAALGQSGWSDPATKIAP